MNKRKNVRSITDSKIFWMVVSLLASMVLWLYVTGTEGVEIKKTFSGVKVEFVGEDELRESSGLIVTEQDNTTVDLTLSGLRRDIGKLSRENLSVQVDLTDIKTDGHYTKLYDIQYPSGVKADDVTVVSRSPESISITIDWLTTKTVEVKGAFTGSTAEGYMAEEALTFDPLAVKVSGPKTVVDTIDCAWVSITRDNVDATISYDSSYALLDKDGNEVSTSGLTLETQEVNVTLTVLMTKTVSLKAALIPGGGAVEDDAIVTVSPSSILLAGDAETLASINQIVVDTVKLANVNSVYDATGCVITIPNDTVNLSGVTTATVHVEIQNLATGTLTANKDDIVCTNVPDGYSAEVITESLQVTVRTAQEDLAAIGEKSLRIVADLSEIGANSGIFYVTVKISVDGYPEAGAVGDYKVYVRMTPAVP